MDYIRGVFCTYTKLFVMKKLCLLCLLFPVFISAQELNIIPRPVDAKALNGNFTIGPKTVVVITDEGDQPAADFFISYVKQYYSLNLKKAKDASKNFIRLNTLKFIRPGTEGKYQLTCGANGVTISGDTYSGTFYGVQTLIQLLPLKRDKSLLVKIPQCEINDQPRFAYRGLHLDVGRHFMPVDFVKRYIDYIALHKMNYFHWHLTEDQGWRIEIKKYPNLTKVGAWRNGTLIGRYPGDGNDNINYGGYYTQEQVKEIVKYAADRFITVVPEIELPGHSSAAIAAYPYLSCFPDEPTKIPANMISKTSTLRQAQGDKKLVQETWGVFVDVFCAGKDETFTFLQDVMDEVMALFPSKYIHVGGDECPKENWKRCPNCQKRIKDNNLKNEHELQSYFIQRMEKYLNSSGRTLIGWDEILEGGLAAKAVVMSWRGEQGGIDAAKQNHDVIMTPGSHVYLDHSQSENEDSVTIGGYTSVEKIYSYEPIPAALNEEQGKYVLGAQANVWTEYMDNTKKVEYMIFPRLSALSEVLWSPKEKKDWSDFEKRLLTQFKRYDLWKTNYSKAFFDLKAGIIPSPDNNGLLWKLETKQPTSEIKYITHFAGRPYELTFTEGKTYTTPVAIKSTQLIAAISMVNGKPVSNPVYQNFYFNKATGKKITLANEPSKNYPGDGALTLVNGVQNEKGRARSNEFLGFNGTDCEAVIDLVSPQTFSSVTIHSFRQDGAWVYQPLTTEVFSSTDGKTFTSLGLTDDFNETKNGNGTMKVNFKSVSARFIKVVVKNWGEVPAEKPGAGNKAWLFVDEIEVN